MDVVIRPIGEAEVRSLLGWRYAPPYDVYNIHATNPDAEVQWFLLPANAYYAIVQRDELIGFCCYGHDAQVPGGEYSDAALDVGIGLRPDLTGHGLGGSIVAAVLDVGRQAFAAQRFRATIVAWNTRAIRTFEQLGFTRTATFATEGHAAGTAWVQLMREA